MTPEQAKKFCLWLTEAGAEVLEPTNEYEVVRFRSGAPGVSVVYRRVSGRVSFTGEAAEAWHAFLSKKAWRARPKPKRKPMTETAQRLLDRDGDRCFYCGQALGHDVTVEHLLAVTLGGKGTNHLANLVLAHERCNQDAGRMTVLEKVLMRERRHAERKARAVAEVLDAVIP